MMRRLETRRAPGRGAILMVAVAAVAGLAGLMA